LLPKAGFHKYNRWLCDIYFTLNASVSIVKLEGSRN